MSEAQPKNYKLSLEAPLKLVTNIYIHTTEYIV